MIHAKNFINAELNGSYELEYTHNLNTTDVIPTWIDNTGVERSTFDLFQRVDANNIKLNCGGAITGTHRLLLSYQSSGESSSGRKAFELTENNDPDLSNRIIFGKVSTPAANMTFTNFLAWLLTKLGFLKIASNLSDLADTITARTNLGVYSISDVDTALATKATLFMAGTGSVLGVSNTGVYIPSANYHPATKIYTDTALIFAGTLTDSSSATPTISSLYNPNGLTITAAASSPGNYTITHNIGNINYFVNGIGYGDTLSSPRTIRNRANNSFGVYTSDDSGINNSDFYFFIYRIPT